MFENIASIDIGQSAIKIVIVKSGLRNFQVKTYSYEDLDLSIENTTEAINEALSRVIEELDLNGYKILTNLPMEQSVIRNIMFPFNDIEKIAEAIPFEAEENIPFALDDVTMDFQLLIGSKENEGKILLGAANKDLIYEYLNTFKNNNLLPVYMGLEANALYQCYDYFRQGEKAEEHESVMLLDIGHNKSIINIVVDNKFQYTRAILIGVGDMHRAFADVAKKPLIEAARLFENLLFDLSSVDKNLKRKNYKSLGITKPKLQKIHTNVSKIVDELLEQISLTLKAYFLENEKIEFDRLLLSGGGSNLIGLSSILQKKLKVIVEPLTIYDDIEEKKIQTQFPIALGTVICYLKERRSTINFLKGEFKTEGTGANKKTYYLGIFFLLLTVIMFLISSITSAFLTSSQHENLVSELKKRYTTHFKKAPTGDPIEEAKKLATKEENKVKKIERLFGKSGAALDALKVITSSFPKGEKVELERFVLNKTIISINGKMGSTSGFDSFKNKLNETRVFNAVKESIRGSGPDGVQFNIRIELKSSKTNKKKTSKSKSPGRATR